MKRLKGFFASLAIVLLLAVGLALWIALPWFAVLALAAAARAVAVRHPQRPAGARGHAASASPGCRSAGAPRASS